MKPVNIGIIQMSCRAEPKQNLAKAIQKIIELKGQGAEIICLPELFTSLYFCQREDAEFFNLAETIPGPTTKALQSVAKEHAVVVVASLFEKRTTGVYHNTTVVIDADGTYLGKYRKMHIPDDPHYYEKFYFTPGDLGYQVFATTHGKVGVLICWDQWFPEAARLTALKGAEVIVYPTAIGWLTGDKEKLGKKQYEAWKTLQRSHAIANEVFVVAPNRVGKEQNIEFWGGSLVIDPFGEVLYQGSHDKEEIKAVTCDLSQVEECRKAWPFLRDRRIDSYQNLLKRFDDEDGCSALSSKSKGQ